MAIEFGPRPARVPIDNDAPVSEDQRAGLKRPVPAERRPRRTPERPTGNVQEEERQNMNMPEWYNSPTFPWYPEAPWLVIFGAGFLLGAILIGLLCGKKKKKG